MVLGPNIFIYIFLFITLYFESFLLVTLLSGPARKQRKRNICISNHMPSTAVIVPCWDEENTIAVTVDSLLALKYPDGKLSIILVDDGSTDGTADVLESYAHYSRIKILKKEHAGKYAALNAGIKMAGDVEIIGCLDADSFVEPESLRIAVPCFERPEVMANTLALSVHAPKNIIQHIQYAEYLFGITMRHVLASINGLYVTPGPFSLYRMEVFKKIGYFTKAYLTEDMEMALRMQRAHMVIENSPHARVYTKAPATMSMLIKQRVRWTTGFLKNMLFEYRDLIGNPHYGIFGMGILPLAILSIFAGAGFFVFFILQIVFNIVHVISIYRGIPLSYIFTPHTFNFLFSFPITVIFLTSIVLLSMTVMFMVIGKRMSNIPGNLTAGTITYILFYWILSPLWLARSVLDTITNTNRSWR